MNGPERGGVGIALIAWLAVLPPSLVGEIVARVLFHVELPGLGSPSPGLPCCLRSSPSLAHASTSARSADISSRSSRSLPAAWQWPRSSAVRRAPHGPRGSPTLRAWSRTPY